MTGEALPTAREVVAFALRMVVSRMQMRIDAASERNSESIGIGTTFAADIVAAASRGSELLEPDTADRARRAAAPGDGGEVVAEARKALADAQKHPEAMFGFDWLTTTAALIARADALAAEVERLEKLVYVPGVWKCAKCGCGLVSTLMHAESGRFAANTEPQQCPNDCGPMWRRTEREAGNELVDRCDEQAQRASTAEASLAAMTERAERYRTACALVLDYYGAYAGWEKRMARWRTQDQLLCEQAKLSADGIAALQGTPDAG